MCDSSTASGQQGRRGRWGSTNANSVVPIKRKHTQLDWLLGQKEHNESVAGDISLLIAYPVPGMVLEKIACFHLQVIYSPEEVDCIGIMLGEHRGGLCILRRRSL